MANQVVCQNCPEIRVDVFQIGMPVVTLWSQLEPARQKQLAQVLAELIRRIRGSPCQKESSDEGQ
jgi:hypothetical protein